MQRSAAPSYLHLDAQATGRRGRELVIVGLPGADYLIRPYRSHLVCGKGGAVLGEQPPLLDRAVGKERSPHDAARRDVDEAEAVRDPRPERRRVRLRLAIQRGTRILPGPVPADQHYA